MLVQNKKWPPWMALAAVLALVGACTSGGEAESEAPGGTADTPPAVATTADGISPNSTAPEAPE